MNSDEDSPNQQNSASMRAIVQHTYTPTHSHSRVHVCTFSSQRQRRNPCSPQRKLLRIENCHHHSRRGVTLLTLPTELPPFSPSLTFPLWKPQQNHRTCVHRDPLAALFDRGGRSEATQSRMELKPGVSHLLNRLLFRLPSASSLPSRLER